MLKGQKKSHSFIEAMFNAAGGYIIAILGQEVLFPLFGIVIPLQLHLVIGLCFTVISVARGYVFRRIFNWWTIYASRR